MVYGQHQRLSNPDIIEGRLGHLATQAKTSSGPPNFSPFQPGTGLLQLLGFFKIKKGKGQFPGGVTSTYSMTGSDGYATMTYQGPTGGEMSAAEEFVTIEVQPETWWEAFDGYGATPTYYYIHVEFDIRLKKGN